MDVGKEKAQVFKYASDVCCVDINIYIYTYVYMYLNIHVYIYIRVIIPVRRWAKCHACQPK